MGDNFSINEDTSIYSGLFDNQIMILQENSFPTVCLEENKENTINNDSTQDCYVSPDLLVKNEDDEYIKREVELDHPYAENTDYRKLYLETENKLKVARKKIRSLNTKLRRYKFRNEQVQKVLKQLKRQAYESAAKLLKNSQEGPDGKPVLPKKMIIVV